MRHSTILEIMLYPANLINDDDKILVTFDDIPEAITFGKNRYERSFMQKMLSIPPYRFMPNVIRLYQNQANLNQTNFW